MPENLIVLDLETLHSADDCEYCGVDMALHGPGDLCATGKIGRPLGWTHKAALGLSIGCYWDAESLRIHWFDDASLEATMRELVRRQPLMVSYNGIGFDFALMRAVLRERAASKAAESPLQRSPVLTLGVLCDQFTVLAARSYDILAEIWGVDPQGKFVKGLNSLDAVCAANGLVHKTGTGAQAPRDWQAGKWAQVLNYCQNDVYLTRDLFALLRAQDGTILRASGPITLRRP